MAQLRWMATTCGCILGGLCGLTGTVHADIDRDGLDEVVSGHGSYYEGPGFFTVWDDGEHGFGQLFLDTVSDYSNRIVLGDVDGDAVDDILVTLECQDPTWLQCANWATDRPRLVVMFSRTGTFEKISIDGGLLYNGEWATGVAVCELDGQPGSEVVVSTTGGARGTPLLRVYSFDPGLGRLVPRASGAPSPNASTKALALACGDFDGRNVQQVVVSLSEQRETGSGYFEFYSLWNAEVTPVVGAGSRLQAHHVDCPTRDLVTGNFDPDMRSELAFTCGLQVRVVDDLLAQPLQLASGGPWTISEVTGSGPVSGISTSLNALATGDSDRDGIDEILVGGQALFNASGGGTFSAPAYLVLKTPSFDPVADFAHFLGGDSITAAAFGNLDSDPELEFVVAASTGSSAGKLSYITVHDDILANTGPFTLLDDLLAEPSVSALALRPPSKPGPTCQVYPFATEARCCQICTRADCSTGRADPHCRFGSAFDSYAVLGSSTGCADYCNGLAAARGPIGQCVPYGADTPEIPDNGLDDNCDGSAPGEELCNGIDDDGNGIADDKPGSCAARHLFVPYCWNSKGLTTEQQHAELVSAMQRWEDFFEAKAGLAHCRDRRPIWTEAAVMNAINVPNGVDGRPDCPPKFEFQWGSYKKFSDQGATMLKALRDTGLYRLEDWDTIAFVTNPTGKAEAELGWEIGGGAVVLRSYPVWEWGDFGVFAHEWGHTTGLSEEYEIDWRQNEPPDAKEPINRLDPGLGCDPGTAVNLPHDTPEFFAALGACCFPYPRSCDPALYNCKSEACYGNRGLALDFWQRWDPNPSFYADPNPSVANDEGRCIMSFANAPGADRGHLPSGSDTERGWCPHCWAHVRPLLPKCDTGYGGDERRVSLLGVLDTYGLMRFIDGEITTGRGGNPMPTSGRLSVTVETQSGAPVGTFAPGNHAMGLGAVASDSTSFWARLPVAAGVELPLRIKSYKDGLVVSRTTLGGQPPVAEAGADQVIECGEAGTAKVMLDGRASSDPDGDTLTYEWSGSDVIIDDPSSATPVVTSLSGTTAVLTLKVSDAVSASTDTVSVKVVDTTPPGFGSLATLTRTVCDTSASSAQVSVPTPVVADTCGSTSAVTGEVIQSNGQAVSIPIIAGAVVLPMGAHVVRWTAVDSFGNSLNATQALNVIPAIFANGSADLRDRAELRTANGGYAPLANAGFSQTLLGVSSHSGTIESRAAVTVRNNAQVHGDVTSNGSITLSPGVSVSGQLSPATPVNLPELPSLADDSFVGGPDISVESGVVTLWPGNYGSAWVNTGARLVFGVPGTYYFSELVLEADSIAESPAAGVRIVIESQFAYRGRLIDVAEHLVPVEVAVAGTLPIWLESPFMGKLIAPNASVTIRKYFAGAVAAKDLLVEPDVLVTCLADDTPICSSAQPTGFCPDDGDPCTDQQCGTTGCSYPAKPNGTPCNDGNACTTGDQCSSGVCGGEPMSCDDGNACTVDNCAAGTCEHGNVSNGAVCDDSNACTINDVCTGGVCGGSVATPSAPSNLISSAGNNNSVNLTWSASTTPGVTYTVKRGTSAGTYGTTVATGLTTTSYLDGALTAGTNYYYVVYAVKCADSAYSNQTTATPSGPPSVSLTAPNNGASFNAPASITITANANDPGGAVSRVEFYRGGTLLGTDNSSPYGYVWTNVAAGSYLLTAKAFDNLGATTLSSAVNVTVTSVSNPCAGLCNPAIVKTGPNIQSGNLGTSAVCHETTSALSGGNCSNMNGRTLKVNASSMSCGGWALPAKRNGGYCIQVTAGGLSYASYAAW